MSTVIPPTPDTAPPSSKRPRDLKGLVDVAKSDSGRTFLKYSAVSGISVVVSQIALIIALHYRTPTVANIISVCVGTVPSYQLNRRWAWGKSGKGHLWREVMPFWIMSFIGLAFSTLCVNLVEVWFVADERNPTGKEKALVALTSLAAFGILWVGKFVIMNKVLFHNKPADEIDPVLDGRSGIPT